MTDHLSVHPEFPPDFAAFQARRQRFFDGLAAETVLRDIARDACPAAGAEEGAMDPGAEQRDVAVRIATERRQDRPA